jgi:hypothetical protein
MNANEVLAGLIEHFGKGLAHRIYACAMIQNDKMEEKMPEADCVRYTVGIIKRIRKQGMVHGHMSWAHAIERLEDEQLAQRHVPVTAMQAHFADESEKLATRYSSFDEIEAKMWIEAYKQNLTEGRLTFVSRIVQAVRDKEELSKNDYRNLSLRYTPEHVKPSMFLELLTRYA